MISRSVICTATGQGQILADWLTANAAGYFDSVTYDSTAGTVTCYVGELDFLTINANKRLAYDNCITIKNAGGKTYSTRLFSGLDYFTAGYTCTNGVVMSNCLTDSQANYPGLIISKDENGGTGIMVFDRVTSRSQSGFSSASGLLIVSSADTSQINNGGYISAPYQTSYIMKTTLCPAVSTCIGSTHYFPNVFLTPWNQAPGTGKLTANGQDYLTTGLVAIKD